MVPTRCAGNGDNDTLVALDLVGNDRLSGGAGTDTCTADGADTATTCEIRLRLL